MSDSRDRPLALVTGASSGIGLELAKVLAIQGYDLVLAADRPLNEVESAVTAAGAAVALSLQVDLSKAEGVDTLYERTHALERPIEILCANAGHGLGEAFFDEDLDEAMGVLETNVLGTIRLIWRVGRAMRDRKAGRILITSSTAWQTPGPWAAVYFASKAALESFGQSLRVENKDTGVGVTMLLPGATGTEFFKRARSTNTKGAQGPMDSAADVAKIGYEALMRGESDVIYGEHNREAMQEARTKSEAQNAEMAAQVLRPIARHLTRATGDPSMASPLIPGAATPVEAAGSAHTAEEARNCAIVRQAFERWTRGEGTVFDLLSADMTWTIEGSSPSAGRYDRARLDALLKPFSAHLAKPLVPRLRELHADGDRVIALFDASAPRTNGNQYENSYAWFLTMRDERIVSVTAFLDLPAFDAVREDR